VKDVFFFSITYSSLSFNADTHDTRSSMEPNRWCRSTTSRSNITKQYGEIRFSLSHDILTIIFLYRHSLSSIFSITV
jgi:hypothetical protein